MRRIWNGAVRRIRARSPRGVVLLYHRIAGPRFDPLLLDVAPASFEAQLAILRRDTTVLPLGEFEARRVAGTLPARAVAVTFDDGYADNLLVAAPALERHGVPATMFVTTGLTSAAREFWWDDIERVAFSPTTLEPPVPWVPMPWTVDDGRPIAAPGPGWTVVSPETPTPRHRLFRAVTAALRPLPTAERDRRLTVLRSWAGVPGAPRETHRPLTRSELDALARRPGIALGAHSVTHPVLGAIPPREQRAELTDSRRWLEDLLARPVVTMAYPFGGHDDVTPASRRAARAAGYATAFVTEPGPAWRWSSALAVPRCTVFDWGADMFARQLNQWLG